MFSTLLAAVTPVWGTVTPPKYANVNFGEVLKWGLRVFFVAIALFSLYYMLTGAFNWVTSNGAEEKLREARDQIAHAIIGLIVAVLVLVFWGLIASNMLGIVKSTNSGQWLLCLPTINGSSCDSTPAAAPRAP